MLKWRGLRELGQLFRLVAVAELLRRLGNEDRLVAIAELLRGLAPGLVELEPLDSPNPRLFDSGS